MRDMPENPAAFPRDPTEECEGMSLRDWFAGQAIMGAVANGSSYSFGHYQGMASQAYLLAEAMLAAREL